jgi:hypothetical protein
MTTDTVNDNELILRKPHIPLVLHSTHVLYAIDLGPTNMRRDSKSVDETQKQSALAEYVP